MCDKRQRPFEKPGAAHFVADGDVEKSRNIEQIHMISVEEAIGIIDQQVPLLGTTDVAISKAVGRILAEDISSDMDLPPFDRSQMDGFAVRSEDVASAPVALRIVGESVAGRGWSNTLNSGEAVRIMTGAPVPKGADSVQIVEVTRESGGMIEILKAAHPGQNIVKMGEEIKNGDFLFPAGTRISRNMIASLASFGYERIKTARKPRVSILSTGSEIVDIGKKPGPDQIRNSNSWSLAEFAREANAKVLIREIAHDDLSSLEKAISEALADCDCLIISGGVSVGDYDFTKPALRNIGAEIFFEKVALKPGKPTVFAKLGSKLIFGLPGNPVSSAVTFFVFVRMALLKMQKARDSGLTKGRALLRHSIKGTNGRDALLPVVLSTDADGRQMIETLKFSGSSNFISFAGSNGLVFVPRDTGLEKNEVADVYHLA